MKIDSLDIGSQLKMLQGVESIAPVNKQESRPEGARDFSEFMVKQIDELNELGLESDKAIERSMRGEEPFPHRTLLALQRAEISFQLMNSIKQKLERAYTQIMQTPIG